MVDDPLNSDGTHTRLVEALNSGDTGADQGLRPLLLEDFVGQERLRRNLSVGIMARRVWEKPRWRRLSLRSWASVFGRRLAP